MQQQKVAGSLSFALAANIFLRQFIRGVLATVCLRPTAAMVVGQRAEQQQLSQAILTCVCLDTHGLSVLPTHHVTCHTLDKVLPVQAKCSCR
eukprot:1008460-Amphidinium_carterae.2